MTPEYKKLAYERATLRAIIRLAKDHYLPKEGADDPELEIESEDLARVDCIVPPEAIISVITKLQNQENRNVAEMQQFQFTKTESSYESEWKEEPKRPPQTSPAQPGPAAGKGKSKGGKGSPQAPAAKRG